jgi:uncharacterized protein involved in copper resistance
MTLRSTAGIVVLAVTVASAQSTPTVVVPGGAGIMNSRQPMTHPRAMSPAGNQTSGAPTPISLRQRMQEMQETVDQMHTLLKQMRTKAASSKSADPLAKANLEMWELMLKHLDRQFDQLRVATLTREDLETRRTAMYKQAEARAAAAKAHAQGSGIAEGTPAPAIPSSTEAGNAAQSPTGATPGQTSAQPSATDSALPKQDK